MPGPDHADAERDALAILAAALAEDVDGVGTVVFNCCVPKVIGALSGMLFEALRDQGHDPAEWVAAWQARAREELAGG
jgi:hypothetical protein